MNRKYKFMRKAASLQKEREMRKGDDEGSSSVIFKISLKILGEGHLGASVR